MIRRVERDSDPWSGQVAFPGGRWRSGEDLLGTAVREVEEEVGVRPTALAGTLPPLSPRNAPWLKVVPYVFTEWVGDPRPNPAEVAEMRWVSRGDLRETEWMGTPAYAVGNWDFIQRLPPRLRAALIYYIETGTSGGRSGSAGLI